MPRHKKTKRHSRRRRHRGGGWLPEWLVGKSTPAPLPGQTLELPPVGVPEAAANAAAPIVNSTVGTPPQQAAAVGTPPGSANILGPTASTGTALGGRRRRRTRKHRRRH